jgi:hypothetical protein
MVVDLLRVESAHEVSKTLWSMAASGGENMMIRVESVLGESLTVPPGGRLPKDSTIHTRCPSCGQTQTLAEATIASEDGETVYTCRNGCQPIVIVGLPQADRIPWEGRGFRLGNYVIRNIEEVWFWVVEGGKRMVLDARPNALAKSR